VRIRPEARFYLPLSRSVILAVRSSLGFLFPADDPDSGGYGDTFRAADREAIAQTPPAIRDQHKLLLRGFFSGGPTSNRGYAYRGVGPQGPVGFLVPTGVNCAAPNLAPRERDACTRPLGGFTLWEASVEFRFPISGPVRGSVFVDAGDVNDTIGELRFSVPHLSVGPGVRYMTPIGPVRADFGLRVPGAQRIGSPGDVPERDGERTTFLGLPAAFHLAIGESF
jgi:outer membrane protein insertion porin family/translocation and assembly module TamA